jgi:perosamine synthetase
MPETTRPPLLAIDGGVATLPEGPPRWPSDDADVLAALTAAYRDGSWGRYDGPNSAALVAAMRQTLGLDHVSLCSSGTIAVELALRGLRVEAGDEVILTGYDFPGNFRAITAIGALPVLVDVIAGGVTIDCEQLDAARSDKTRAIVVSHLHGNLAPIERIVAWAQQYQIAVVEDACQVPGASLGGKPIGTWGDAATFSFGGSKLLTAGRGGAVVTRLPEVQQRIKIHCEQGNHAFPLSELQAAVLLPQWLKLPQRHEQRRLGANRLIQQLKALGVVSCHEPSVPLLACPAVLSDVAVDIGESTSTAGQASSGTPVANRDHSGLRTLFDTDPTHDPAYYKLALWHDPAVFTTRSRDAFVAAVEAEGVAIGAGFRGFAGRGASRCRKVGELSNSRAAAERLMLVHHPVLLESAEILDRVAAAIGKVARASKQS